VEVGGQLERKHVKPEKPPPNSFRKTSDETVAPPPQELIGLKGLDTVTGAARES